MKFFCIQLFILLFIITGISKAQINISIITAPNNLNINDSINKDYKIEIFNKDTISYILYNFPSAIINIRHDIDSIFTKSAAIGWFSIYDINNNLIFDYNKKRDIFFIPIETYFLDSLDSSSIDFYKDIYKDWLNNKIVLKPCEKQNEIIKFNIAALNINSGTYFIKYNYVNGINLKYIIDENKIIKDEKVNKAKVFYGCIQSKFFEIKVYK